MINISDIQRKLTEFPEPKEVTEIRENILNSFNKLEFVEEGHKYFLPQKDGTKKELTSVSVFTHQFQQEQDWDDIARRYAVKNDMDVEDVKRMWHENNIRATSNGSKTHFAGEVLMNFVMGNETCVKDNLPFQYTDDGYFIPYGGKETAVAKFWEDIINTKGFYPVLAETKVYMGVNDKFLLNKPGFAGTFDMLFAFNHNGKWKLSILDYKGLPVDTPIATVDGWKTMGELKEGDVVFDKNGEPTKVIHKSIVHYNPCYKIYFDNNDTIIADKDHRWEITFKTGDKNKPYKLKVVTTEELYEYINSIEGKRNYCNIPVIFNAEALKCEEKDLPIDPYVFGVWLGNGNKIDGKITNMHQKIWDEIAKRGYTIGNDVSQGGAGKATIRTIGGLTTKLRKLGVLGNKHIPDIYMRASYEQRVDLLRGFMDADGYYNPIRNNYVVDTTKEIQAKWTVELLATLGIKSTTHSYNITFNEKQIPVWCVAFSSNELQPFLCRIPQNKREVKNVRHKMRTIKRVESVDTVPTQCIEVDSPTHTYLCTKSLIVTHNTNASLSNTYNQRNDVRLLSPFNDMIEESTSLYTLQLSAYSLALQQLDYEIADRKLIWLKDDGTYEKISVPDVSQRILQFLQS